MLVNSLQHTGNQLHCTKNFFISVWKWSSLPDWCTKQPWTRGHLSWHRCDFSFYPIHLRINAQMQKAILHGDTSNGSMRILSQFSQLSLCNEYVPRNMKRNHKDICMNKIIFSSRCAIQIWEITFRWFFYHFKKSTEVLKWVT